MGGFKIEIARYCRWMEIPEWTIQRHV